MKVFSSSLLRRPGRRLLAGLLLLVLGSIASARQQPGARPGQRAASANPQTPTRQRSSSDRGRGITGRVVEEGGQPIAEASVFALPAGAANSASPLPAYKLRTALTDETGRFAIDELPSGAYTLTTFIPGYVSVSPTPGQSAYYRPGDSVSLYMVKGGVITGAVTAPNGEAMAGVRVRPVMVKDSSGGPVRTPGFSPLTIFQDWKTDDRGIYRIFGLEPGSYLVSAGGRGMLNLLGMSVEGYDNDAPTFHPSATRDTAVEVRVRGGEEASGIDIRYREGRGHAISGAVSGKSALTSNSAILVTLTHAATGGVCALSIGLFSVNERSFEFDGVPDGEYDLMAMVGFQTDDVLQSRPRRVEVRGADVTGLELELGPLGAISGRVVLEKAQAADPKVCPPVSNSLALETVLSAKVDAKGKEPPRLSLQMSLAASDAANAVPDEKGEFKIRPLETGRYRLLADLPGENSFVRAITMPAPIQAGRPVDAARNGIGLKQGERVAGVTVTIAEGAAGLKGRVVPSKQGASLPSSLRVYMVPAEKDTDDEVLRFFEAPMDQDGAFSFKHVAPGRYFLMAREASEDEGAAADSRPAAWRGAASRKKLRSEAEAFNVPVQLSQCQRVIDQALRFSSPERTVAPPR